MNNQNNSLQDDEQEFGNMPSNYIEDVNVPFRFSLPDESGLSFVFH